MSRSTDGDLAARPARRRFDPAERRLILGAAIGMSGGFAAVFNATFGLFLKPIGATLGAGRAGVALLLTAGFLGYSLGALGLGPAYDRFGARSVLTGGVVVFAIALMALGAVPAPLPAMAALCLLLGIAGATTAPTGYVLIIAKQVRDRLGFALGLAMLGVGFGIVVMPLVAQRLIAALGWRGAYAMLGAMAFGTGVVALVLIGRPQRRMPSVGLSKASEGATVREALASWRYWLIASHALLIGTIGFGTSAHLVAVVTDHRIDPAVAARGAAFVGLGLFIARIGVALLLDHVYPPLIAAGACMFGSVGVLLLSGMDAEHVALLPLVALLIGLLIGSEGDTLPYLVRRYFGTRSFGAIFGGVIFTGGMGGVIGPILFGRVFDVTGSYDGVLRIASLFGFASGSVLLVLGGGHARRGPEGVGCASDEAQGRL